MATRYRCYLLDHDRIVAEEPIESDDDATAVLKADQILGVSRCTEAEIWDYDRKVSIISRKATAG